MPAVVSAIMATYNGVEFIATAAVSSVDPSSTMISSQSVNV